MTALAQEILNTFDRLADAEKLEIAREILRLLVHFDFPPLTDEDFMCYARQHDRVWVHGVCLIVPGKSRHFSYLC
jgi:hypothetical protein